MEEKSNSDVETNDFSISELNDHPPISEIRSFLYNSLYPSDMALHYLILNKPSNSQIDDSKFFEIAKNNAKIILYPKSFDADWIQNFIESTINSPKKNLTVSLLKSIYFSFFDVIASQKYEDLNDNLDLFLKLTQDINNPIVEILHCRILSIILLLKLKIEFDPNKIHKISEFDTRNLHMILKGYQENSVKYSSLSLINFAIMYCIPSAIIDNEITKYDQKKEIPNLIQIIPEPEFIFYYNKYFEDDVFDFASFLLQSIYGYVQNEINTFDEENKDDYNNNFGIIPNSPKDNIKISNAQLKIKSLLDLFLNNSIVTGTFLRVIFMFDKDLKQSDKVLKKISKILSQCPKIRLSVLLRCQYLLSFYDLYSANRDTIFNPENGDFFADIPENFEKYALFTALSPYWSPQDSIIKIYDKNNPSLLIPHAIAMINRCRIEHPNFLSEISEISAIQIAGTLTQIFDNLVLCDNFSSKQTEEILFMGISSFFQLARRNSQIIHQNLFLRRITVIAVFKSLQFIYKTPQFSIVSEYGLFQKHSYLVISNFISENVDIFKGYINTYNNINNFFERATIIQALRPRIENVMLYFQIFLRATSYQQFWLAIKFMRSLTYLKEDVQNLENLVFQMKEPILIKNALLFMTELILKKDGFGELLVENEDFNKKDGFSTQIVRSFDEDEIGEAALFLLCALYTKNLIKPEHKIKIQYVQIFFDKILDLNEGLYQTLLDVSVMICISNNKKSFPFKIKHQKQAFNDRPDSISKHNFLVFMFINYPEIGSRCSKPPTDYEILIKNDKTFSFMSILNRPYRYLIKPVLFEGVEIENEEEEFEFVKNKRKDPEIPKEKK